MKRFLVRLAVAAFGAALVVSAGISTARSVFAADTADAVSIGVSAAQPRTIEDQTQRALEKQYAAAWTSLAQALDENRADKLNAAFVGAARDEFAGQIDQARKSSLSSKITGLHHDVQAVFYSPEGTAI